ARQPTRNLRGENTTQGRKFTPFSQSALMLGKKVSSFARYYPPPLVVGGTPTTALTAILASAWLRPPSEVDARAID
ncbi:MAG TPA: hypothetical protein PK228_05975, partial [Saprospiraceae bacterium]|nr:hypothetical protein [Saprospiraceae bacterium]